MEANTATVNLTPLELEARPNITTREAARHLNRAPQTLRAWAAKGGNGPLSPVRINGRLAWPTAELRKLTGVGAE